MSGPGLHKRFRRFGREEDGSTLVEFGISFVVFLLIFFAIIDFGRMAFNYVVAEKALHMAARIAAVRPVLTNCVNSSGVAAIVPQTIGPATGTTAAYGTLCRSGGACATPGPFFCTGAAGQAAVDEIWPIVQGRLPSGTTQANLLFRYDTDTNLGFLGGPYVPIVTVQMQNACFNFTGPVSGMIRVMGGTPGAGLGATGVSGSNCGSHAIPFPTLSVSMPGEDLNVGEAG